jgi:hypothetical protein
MATAPMRLRLQLSQEKWRVLNPNPSLGPCLLGSFSLSIFTCAAFATVSAFRVISFYRHSRGSTLVRLGLNPILIVLNSDGYGTMRQIRDGGFNTITQWNYSKICELMRTGESSTASTKGEFDEALTRVQESDRVYVIELKIPRTDVSGQLARIAAEVCKMRGRKSN